MDPKVSPQFWTDRDVIELDSSAKLAAFWMITNSGVNLVGYAEVSPKVFRFETEADAEAMGRACDGLARNFVRTERGYWLRNFIRYQLGAGESLTRNKMCGPLLRDLRTVPEPVRVLVLAQYPELVTSWDRFVNEASPPLPAKPLASPAHAHGMDQSRAERSRAERSRAEQSGAQGGAGGSRAATPAELGEPLASRLISIGLLKARQASEVWSPAELASVRDARLDTISEEDFQAQMAPMRAYYFANIPRGTGKDRRRRDLGTLLANWPGELDRAREYARGKADNLVRH